jgi:hypothetical protein
MTSVRATRSVMTSRNEISGDDPIWGRARSNYEAAINKWGPDFPKSQVVLDARFGLMELKAKQLTSGRHGVRLEPQLEWEEIRGIANKVISEDPRPGERVNAYLAICESLAWEGRHEATRRWSLAALDVLGQRVGFRENIAWLHIYAGIGADGMRDNKEVLWRLDLAQPLAGNNYALNKQILFRRWVALSNLEAPQAERDAIKTEFIKRYPDSPYVQFMESP